MSLMRPSLVLQLEATEATVFREAATMKEIPAKLATTCIPDVRQPDEHGEN